MLLLVWVLSFFVVFSLATLKREPYLMTMVPGIGLMIGYLYHHVLSSAAEPVPMPRLLKSLLVVLAVVFVAGMFVGAGPLRRRWLVSSVALSPVFIMTIVALAGEDRVDPQEHQTEDQGGEEPHDRHHDS